MNQVQIAEELLRITQLPSLQFQKELPRLRDAPLLLRLLGDLLASHLSDNHKQMAAVAINRIIEHRIDSNYRQWRSIWNEFRQQILCHPQVGKIQWRHLRITGKAVQKLMDQFDSQFCQILNPLFSSLSLNCKALIYDTFLVAETTEQTRYVFLRQTIQNLLRSTLQFVCAVHDRGDEARDVLLLQQSLVQSIQLLFVHLSQDKYQKILELMIKVSQNNDLLLLIVEELAYPGMQKYENVLKKTFTPAHMNELVLFSQDKNPTMREHLNGIKSNILKILTNAVKKYDRKAGQDQFDFHKFLNFMQNLTPLSLDCLIHISTSLHQHYSPIIISHIQFLSTACKFNFLLQFFQCSIQVIYCKVCLPLLAVSQQQMQDYEESCQEFINISEQVIQYVEEKGETWKNYAGMLLENICQTVHGSIMFITEYCCEVVAGRLDGERRGLVEQFKLKYGCQGSVEAALMVLSIMSSKYMQRPDLVEMIKKRMLQHKNILSLKGLDKARLLIFLAYNYETFYDKALEQGTPFLAYANQGLDEGGSIAGCSLLLFQNCIKLGFGSEIWSSLIQRIANTASLQVFKLLKKIVKKMLLQLPADKVKQLLQCITDRLICEYKRCSDQSLQGVVTGNKYLYLCLGIIEQVSHNSVYLREESSIIDSIWPVLDLFEFSGSIQFQDNILQIYNNILEVKQPLRFAHFNFIDAFSIIHQKHGGFGKLVATYSQLLTKGGQLYIQDPTKLQKVISSLKQCYGIFKKQQSLKYVCIWMHFVYSQYGNLLKRDQQFRDKLYDIYREEGAAMREETRAAMVNLFICGQYCYGGYNLDIIQQNNISIFKGYQAQLFSFGIRKLIQKDYESDSIFEYLRYAIRLLHFIREINTSQSQVKQNYYTPIFQQFNSIDPFAQICLTLDFLKRTISHQRYDRIIEQLTSQIALGQIKDLLSRRIVQKSVRTFHKVKNQ